MTTDDRGELDAWILSVLGIENATFEPSRAMAVLKKCGEITFPTTYKSRASGEWVCDNQTHQGRKIIIQTAETLELAICLFAKKLFSK